MNKWIHKHNQPNQSGQYNQFMEEEQAKKYIYIIRRALRGFRWSIERYIRTQ